MGAVYKAHHIALDIPVAVKILSPYLINQDTTFGDRFIREARAAAKLQHPNVVGVLNVGQEGDAHFLVMQFVDGQSLDERVAAEGRIAADESVGIMTQLCEALQVAHESGIVHRDIKPGNIMVDKSGTVKLLDLGLAKNIGEDVGLTASGVGMGTPTYMAPEQADDAKSADHRSDVYSLGCTWFHLITGAVPFDGDSGFTIMTKHQRERVPRAHAICPEVPKPVAAIIQKMMSKRPEDRYQTVAELRADLARLATGAPVAASSSAVRGSKRTWLVASGVATLLIVAGLVARQWLQPASQGEPQDHTAVHPTAKGVPSRRGSARVQGGAPTDGPAPEARPFRSFERDDRGHMDGSMDVGDWHIAESVAGRNRRFLSEDECTLADGVLTVGGRADQGSRTLIYEPRVLEGPFALTIEAKNLPECGIAHPFHEDEVCRITLADAPGTTPASSPWRRIEIHRQRGKLTCSVDGEAGHAIRGQPASFGHFWLALRADVACSIRKFVLEGGQRLPGGKRPRREFGGREPPQDDRR